MAESKQDALISKESAEMLMKPKVLEEQKQAQALRTQALFAELKKMPQDIEAIKKLLRAGVNIDATQKDDLNNLQSPLSIAVQLPNLELITLFLDNDASSSQKGILGKAVRGNDLQVVELLLAKGVREEEKLYAMDLVFAAVDARNPSILKALLECRIISKETLEAQHLVSRETPLARAAKEGKVGHIKVLLEAKADCFSKDSTQAPMVLAAEKGHDDAVSTLSQFMIQDKNKRRQTLQQLLLSLEITIRLFSESFGRKYIQERRGAVAVVIYEQLAQHYPDKISRKMLIELAKIAATTGNIDLLKAIIENKKNKISAVEEQSICFFGIKGGHVTTLNYFLDRGIVKADEKLHTAAIAAGQFPILERLYVWSSEKNEKKASFFPPLSPGFITSLPTLFSAMSIEQKGETDKEINENTKAIVGYIKANSELIAREIKSVTNKQGFTLLQYAATVSSPQVFAALFKIAGDPLTVTNFENPPPGTPNGASLLHLSVGANNLGVASWLCANYFEDIFHLKTESGSTAMQLAKHLKNKMPLKLLQLYQAKEDIAEQKRTKRFNPELYLDAAIRRGELLKIALVVGQEKVNIHADHNLHPESPTAVALVNGNLEVIQYFFECGVSLSDRGVPFLAVKSGQVSIIKFLESKGIDFYLYGSENNFPIHVAAQNGCAQVVEHLSKSYPHLANAGNNNGDTPLHLAVRNNHIQTVEILLGITTDVSANNRSRETPLSIAVNQGGDQIVELLINKLGKERDKSKLAKELGEIFLKNYNNFRSIKKIPIANFCNIAKTVLAELKKIKPTLVTEPMKAQLTEMLAASGDLDAISKLESKEISATNDGGATLLHSAVLSNSEKLIRYLIEEKGIKVSVGDKKRETPLHYAVQNQCFLAMHVLIACGADLTLPDSKGFSPLSSAAIKGQDESVFTLLEDDRSKNFLTPEYKMQALKDVVTYYSTAYPYEQERLLEVIKIFAHFGCQLTPEQYDTFGVPVAKIAIIQAKLKEVTTIRLLLESIDDINLGGVKTAIANGVNVNLKTTERTTPLALVFLKMNEVYKPDEKGAITPESKKVLRELLEIARILMGAGVTEVDYNILANDTFRRQVQAQLNAQECLWQGIQNGNPKQIEKAISQGANVNELDEKGVSPLGKAVKEGKAEVVRSLLDAKADLTVADKKGQTPLHVAASQGNRDVVKCLLQQNPDATIIVNAKDKQGFTPLDQVFIEIDKCFQPEHKGSAESIARRPTLLTIVIGLVNKGATPNYDLLENESIRKEVKRRIDESVFNNSSGLFSKRPIEPLLSSVLSSSETLADQTKGTPSSGIGLTSSA